MSDKKQERCLVIAPGFAHHSGTPSFIAIASRMAEEMDVMCLDFRGTGKSEGRFGFGWKEHLDLNAVCSEALKQYSEVSLTGFSLGAYTSIRTAHAMGDCLKSVLLVSPPPKVEAVVYSGGAFLQPIVYPWDPVYTCGESHTDVGFKWGWMFHSKPDARDLVKDIKVPLHFMAGEKDRLVFPSLTKKIYDNASQPETWTLVGGVTHAQRIYHVICEDFISWVNRCL